MIFVTPTPKSVYTALTFVIVWLLLGASLSTQASSLNWSTIKKEIRQKFPEVVHISSVSLEAWLESPNRTQPRLLDVRTLAEYNISHLQSASRALTLKEALTVLDNAKKQTPIVVYCSVGYRSSKLAQSLQKAGFSNVSNLEGGIFNWKNEDRPVYKSGQRVQMVHPYSNEWGVLLKK